MDASLNSQMSKNWFYRYRLYHIPFWIVYNFIWWAVALGNPIKAFHALFFSPFSIKFSFYVIFQALAVCFNLYFLIPKFLEKGRYVAYLTCLLFTVLLAAILILPGYYLTAYMSGKTMKELYGPEAGCVYQFFGAALPATIASMTLGMSIKLAKSWIQTRRRQQILEKEKLETELNFLKYQFNPHFLFNTINSIFFLIHKNPNKASASLAKFSELLRYQLYECNDTQIQLSKEIACLENSVELEKLRQNDNVEVSLQVDQGRGDAEHLGIAPFMLMTFVENAFKHVSKDSDKPNWIRIKLDIDGQQLDFTVSNSVSGSSISDVVHYGGIGLKNVQRRLDLLYQDHYDLDIQNKGACFEIRLRLHLSRLAESQPVASQPIQKTA